MNVKTDRTIFIDGKRADHTSLCEECGGKVGRLKVERDEEGWIWCRGCGLVKNDGLKTRLDAMSEGAWYDFVKVLVPDIRIVELRMLKKSKSRMDAVKKLVRIKRKSSIQTNIQTNIQTLDMVIIGDI